LPARIGKQGVLIQACEQILDSVNATSKVHDVYLAFFGNSTESTRSLKDASIKIHMLLSWSVGFGHLGNHRPYLCSSLLQLFKEDKIVTGTKGIDCGLWLEDVIFEWLDRAASERNEHKYIAIGTTIGELTRLGLFSLGHYLRRQIARGINDRSAQERIGAQQLRRLLQHLPIFASSPALVSQRKVVLFGDMNAPDEQEEEIEQVRREIGEYLSDLGTGCTLERFGYLLAASWLSAELGCAQMPLPIRPLEAWRFMNYPSLEPRRDTYRFKCACGFCLCF
jgi:hypothetical protein